MEGYVYGRLPYLWRPYKIVKDYFLTTDKGGSYKIATGYVYGRHSDHIKLNVYVSKQDIYTFNSLHPLQHVINSRIRSFIVVDRAGARV